VEKFIQRYPDEGVNGPREMMGKDFSEIKSKAEAVVGT